MVFINVREVTIISSVCNLPTMLPPGVVYSSQRSIASMLHYGSTRTSQNLLVTAVLVPLASTRLRARARTQSRIHLYFFNVESLVLIKYVVV